MVNCAICFQALLLQISFDWNLCKWLRCCNWITCFKEEALSVSSWKFFSQHSTIMFRDADKWTLSTRSWIYIHKIEINGDFKPKNAYLWEEFRVGTTHQSLDATRNGINIVTCCAQSRTAPSIWQQLNLLTTSYGLLDSFSNKFRKSKIKMYDCMGLRTRW